MSENDRMERMVSDEEYAAIRRHLSDEMALFFDWMKTSGKRLSEAAPEDTTRYLVAWDRARKKASGRWP